MSSFALYRGFHLHRAAVRRSSGAPPGAQTSILRRIFATIKSSQRRHTEQEAGRFIAKHGGRLTDEVERQLVEHLCGGRGFLP
jgi:hypothetical protein